MMQVLYISYDGMTDPLGQSQVIPYLIGLTNKGVKFTILSCEKKEQFLENKDVISDILSAASITWKPIFYTKSPPILSTLYDNYKLRKTAQLLHNKTPFDIIHCRSYIASLIGQWMKKKYDLPFIFDMRGFWADERLDGRIWDVKKPVFKLIYSYFKKKEIEFLNQSAAIVSLTTAGKNEILTWDKIDFGPDKITVIPCCVDTDLFDPVKPSSYEKAALKLELGITENDLVIGYLGSIGTWYMIDEMMQFFSLLKKEALNAKLLFVTHNSAAEIIDKAIQYGINVNDVIITAASRKQVPLYISIFSYGLFFIKPAYSKKASSPTKQGELMAMGIPVICNYGVGDTDVIVAKYKSGVIVKDGNFIDSVNLIAGGKNHYDGTSIRAGAIDYFSLKRGVDSYSKIYKI